MCCTACKREFKYNNFGFGCNAEECESFYVSQWSECRLAFLLYRLVMALHSLGWTIGYYAWCKVHCQYQMEHSYRYLTLWSDFLRTGYFIGAAILLLINLDNKGRRVKDQGLTKWLRMGVWFLHNIALSSNLAATMFFWPFVAPDLKPGVSGSAINVFLHAVNSGLMVVDLFVVAFPIRLLHVVYSMLLGMAYCLHTIILWKVGDIPAVYAVMDWKNRPEMAGLFSLASTCVGTPIVQLLAFGIYLLRKRCHSKITASVEEDPNANLENYALTDDHQLEATLTASDTKGLKSNV